MRTWRTGEFRQARPSARVCLASASATLVGFRSRTGPGNWKSCNSRPFTTKPRNKEEFDDLHARNRLRSKPDYQADCKRACAFEDKSERTHVFWVGHQHSRRLVPGHGKIPH